MAICLCTGVFIGCPCLLVRRSPRESEYTSSTYDKKGAKALRKQIRYFQIIQNLSLTYTSKKTPQHRLLIGVDSRLAQPAGRGVLLEKYFRCVFLLQDNHPSGGSKVCRSGVCRSRYHLLRAHQPNSYHPNTLLSQESCRNPSVSDPSPTCESDDPLHYEYGSTLQWICSTDTESMFQG